MRLSIKPALVASQIGQRGQRQPCYETLNGLKSNPIPTNKKLLSVPYSFGVPQLRYGANPLECKLRSSNKCTY
jgi:hypothetical protein